jgi:hypothetical protein
MGDAVRATARGTGKPGPQATDDGTAWIDWAVRIFYVHPRTIGRRAQLCLRDPEGRELGWKDLASGRVMVRDQVGRSSLVRAILEAAGPPPAPLSAENLPGVALDIPGGAVLAQLRLRSAALLIGRESGAPGDRGTNGHGDGHGDGHHRLYATFARPGRDTVALGYVDLQTGDPHASPESASALDPETAAQLLHAVMERRPREHLP